MDQLDYNIRPVEQSISDAIAWMRDQKMIAT